MSVKCTCCKKEIQGNTVINCPGCNALVCTPCAKNNAMLCPYCSSELNFVN